MAHLLQTLASFALVLGVLVFVHELGHYIAARACGVYVEAFSIGFGRPLLSWTARSGTVWKIGILPLGGYVKMHGMSLDTRDEAASDAASFRDDEAYFRKSVWSRMLIAAAGPIANFLLAFVLFTTLYAAVGREVPLPVVGQVVPGSAAAAADLKPGDDIVAVDGSPVTTFEALRDRIAVAPGRDLALAVRRGAADLTLRVHVADEDGAGRLGVTSGRTERIHLSPVGAVAAGGGQTWFVFAATFKGLWHILTTGHGVADLGGPIMIAQLSGKVAALGALSLVTFIALLSVNLGLVNLLPIPILDGGHLMFYAAEALRGRPVPARAQEYGYRLGFAIIASVFVFVSFNDLVHTGALRWVSRLVG